MAPHPTELAPHFPQFEILELIGQGGMGAVYKARQRQLNRLVALKILPHEVAADSAFAERFMREAQALAQLSHPHVVTIYDFGWAEVIFYFLMEFVDGLNLRRLIADGKLQPREALAIVPQICEALQYAHDEGVVHRDIKPENILIDRKGRVKIADFGLAKLLRRVPGDGITLTAPQQVMGTPHYMAPEQMERPQTVDHRADIYSLGVVFYEMLTGELPLGRFAPPSRKAQVDVRLDEVVLRSLEKEPERRYQHASDVKSDVETISRQPSTPPAQGRAGFDEPRSQVRGPAIGLLGRGAVTYLVFGLLLALGGWMLLSRFLAGAGDTSATVGGRDGHPLQSDPLQTARPRNPWGVDDVVDPDGNDVQEFAALAKLDASDEDENATQWAGAAATGTRDSLDGEWFSRWAGGDAGNDWVTGAATVKAIGDRVFILHEDEDEQAYLIESRRRGADRLVGRYRSLRRPWDSEPWVGRIVSPERIDGVWTSGRWDLRRKLAPEEKSPTSNDESNSRE